MSATKQASKQVHECICRPHTDFSSMHHLSSASCWFSLYDDVTCVHRSVPHVRRWRNLRPPWGKALTTKRGSSWEWVGCRMGTYLEVIGLPAVLFNFLWHLYTWWRVMERRSFTECGVGAWLLLLCTYRNAVCVKKCAYEDALFDFSACRLEHACSISLWIMNFTHKSCWCLQTRMIQLSWCVAMLCLQIAQQVDGLNKRLAWWLDWSRHIHTYMHTHKIHLLSASDNRFDRHTEYGGVYELVTHAWYMQVWTALECWSSWPAWPEMRCWLGIPFYDMNDEVPTGPRTWVAYDRFSHTCHQISRQCFKVSLGC